MLHLSEQHFQFLSGRHMAILSLLVFHTNMNVLCNLDISIFISVIECWLKTQLETLQS